MTQILHTTLEPGNILAAAADQLRYDLPTNPLSHIIITLMAANNAAHPGLYAAGAAAVMSKISNAKVTYRGATVVDGDPLDLLQVHAGFSHWYPSNAQVNDTDNATRGVSWVIPFGRFPYDPDECFPATRRGDLVLTLDTIADPAGLDTFILEIETVELLDAAPSRFIKVTTSQQIMAAGDVNDVRLPVGNKLLGVLMRAATYPTGASFNSSIADGRLKVDNVEAMYSHLNWHGLHALWHRRHRIDWLTYGHQHTVSGSAAAAAAYAQATALGIAADADATQLTTGTAARKLITGIDPQPELAALQQYGLLEFDPRNDLSYALDTRGAADIIWHVNSNIADATASRFLPIEYVEIAGGAGGGG